MKTATRSEAEKGLGALLDIVQKGETVLIVDGDRPIARLEPPSAPKVDARSALPVSNGRASCGAEKAASPSES